MCPLFIGGSVKLRFIVENDAFVILLATSDDTRQDRVYHGTADAHVGHGELRLLPDVLVSGLGDGNTGAPAAGRGATSLFLR